MRAYHDAAVKKDAAALEKLISSASLKMFENPDVPIDRLLLAMPREVPDAVPGMRNEKITGERASLEVQNAKNRRWDAVLFVKVGRRLEAGARRDGPEEVSAGRS